MFQLLLLNWLFLDIFDDESLYLIISLGKGIYISRFVHIIIAPMRAGGCVDL